MIDKVKIVPSGYWGFTPEATLFCGEKWKPVHEVFCGFDERTQDALTYAPKVGEWVARIELWDPLLYAALPLALYSEAVAILCEWAFHCMEKVLNWEVAFEHDQQHFDRMDAK